MSAASSGGKIRTNTIVKCSPTREQFRQAPASESESDVDQKLPLAVVDSDDTDGVQKLMNSTLESFSENAWDHFQDLPYTDISEDPTEEKLDDTALQVRNLEKVDAAIKSSKNCYCTD